VWGDADTCFKPSFAERLADVFPDATITRVPGGRTLISLDYPDEVAAVIAEAVGVPVG
jgi:pimeloyl-ACP methyl ester carboxylesterase